MTIQRLNTNVQQLADLASTQTAEMAEALNAFSELNEAKEALALKTQEKRGLEQQQRSPQEWIEQLKTAFSSNQSAALLRKHTDRLMEYYGKLPESVTNGLKSDLETIQNEINAIEDQLITLKQKVEQAHQKLEGATIRVTNTGKAQNIVEGIAKLKTQSVPKNDAQFKELSQCIGTTLAAIDELCTDNSRKLADLVDELRQDLEPLIEPWLAAISSWALQQTHIKRIEQVAKPLSLTSQTISLSHSLLQRVDDLRANGWSERSAEQKCTILLRTMNSFIDVRLRRLPERFYDQYGNIPIDWAKFNFPASVLDDSEPLNYRESMDASELVSEDFKRTSQLEAFEQVKDALRHEMANLDPTSDTAPEDFQEYCDTFNKLIDIRQNPYQFSADPLDPEGISTIYAEFFDAIPTPFFNPDNASFLKVLQKLTTMPEQFLVYKTEAEDGVKLSPVIDFGSEAKASAFMHMQNHSAIKNLLTLKSIRSTIGNQATVKHTFSPKAQVGSEIQFSYVFPF